MMRRVTASALFLLLASASAAFAQQTESPPVPAMVAPPREEPRMTLRVQVVISRHDGDRTISRVPHTILATTGRAGPTQMRIGSQVPILTGAGASYNYNDVGTSIDCLANALESGVYQLRITVEDTSPFESDQQDTANRPPTFRSFKTSQTVLLKDGQTTQFTAATDKVSGEVIRIEVGMTVVK